MASKMAAKGPGKEMFWHKDSKNNIKDVPLKMNISGNVNGESFHIEGEGAGNSSTGKIKGKWVLTSPGEMPMSWAALAPTFAYGFKVYAKYPNHIPSFFQESFPNGYTQRRITRFSRLHSDTDIVDEEGTMETFHEVFPNRSVKNTWHIENTVTLKANFKEGSCLLEADALSIYLQNLERTYPCGDGIKNYAQFLYPIKDDPNGDMLISTQMTHHRPREVEGVTMKVPLPPHHFKRVECLQWKDPSEERDHRCQDEICEQFEFAHEGSWTQIGMPEIEDIKSLTGKDPTM